MDLRCDEVVGGRIDSNFAGIDPTMSRDPRVIENLIQLEGATIPRMDYFKSLQTDLKPFMRKFVAIWMLEVNFNNECFVNYFYLMNVSNKKFAALR